MSDFYNKDDDASATRPLPPWVRTDEDPAVEDVAVEDVAPLPPATPSRQGVAEQVRKVIHPDGRLEILDHEADVPEGSTLVPYTGTP